MSVFFGFRTWALALILSDAPVSFVAYLLQKLTMVNPLYSVMNEWVSTTIDFNNNNNLICKAPECACICVCVWYTLQHCKMHKLQVKRYNKTVIITNIGTFQGHIFNTLLKARQKVQTDVNCRVCGAVNSTHNWLFYATTNSSLDTTIVEWFNA